MSTIRELALACRDAAQVVAALDSTAKRALLRDMAAALETQAAAVLDANARDMQQAAAKGVQGAMLDRLRLDETRVAGIANALREVAELPDPVGVVTRRETRPNGLSIERVRIPLGVIAMIYEARPNVTADAAALCLMAGNGVILRGGSEAIHSNTAIASVLKSALEAHGVPAAALTLVEDLSRETMVELLQLSDIVDLATARQALEQSGAAAVMMGRGAQGQPWSVGQVGDALAGLAPRAAPAGTALADVVIEHYDGVLEEYGMDVRVRAARKHLDWYLQSAGLAPHKDVRWSLLNSPEPQDVRRMIRDLFAGPLLEAP